MAKRSFFILAALLLGAVASPGQAELVGVSGRQAGNQLTTVAANGDPTQVGVSLSHGFPLWYDDGIRKLQLCLDTGLTVAPGVRVNPCEYEPPAGAAPPSFPGNFGAEALYWTAAAFGTFTSTPNVLGTALLVMALEGTGANAAVLVDGNQAVFSRIRIRIDVPVQGTYRVTHPFGSRDYVILTPGLRAINQTQDFGILTPQDFLVAMRDAAAPPVEPPFFVPALDAGIVNADGATIGPFLVPANPHGGVFDPADPATFAGGPITLGGVTYIGLPFAPPAPAAPTLPVNVLQPVTGSPFGTNFFRIELLDPPAGFQLNPSNIAEPQVVQFDNFLLVGKVFNAAVNAIPLALDDVAGAATGGTANVDVVLNDADAVGAGNVHTIDPRAIAVADAGGPVLNALGMPRLTATLPTAAGGSVQRITSIPTGKATFLYTPPAGYSGPDSFQYAIQDQGGLISAPATVGITVEDLQVAQADFRSRTGKWRLRGTSSDSLGNTITLTSGPRAALTPDQEVQVPAVVSDARGSLSLRVSDSAIEYLLRVDPLPTTAITRADIHVGLPGTNGPVIFSLFNAVLGQTFASPRSGTLTGINLLAQPASGVGSFSEAIAAILSGSAYVKVSSAAFPAGELRGQLQRPLIGSAPVVEGVWEFRGGSTTSPGGLPGIAVESDNSVRVLGTPVRLR